MKESLLYDYIDLEREYLQLRRALYKNLFLYIMATNMIIMTIEVIRAIVMSQLGSILSFTILLAFTIILSKVILNIKDKQEIIITVFITLLYLAGIVTNYYAKPHYFNNPFNSFYFAYALAFFERVVLARIPTSSYRTAYNICTTIFRILVIPSSDKGVFTAHLVYVFSGIYLDIDKERHDKKLFQSYFTSKNQLEKFKRLVVNDIPEGIAIISQDLTQCLLANNPFAALFEIEPSKDIQAQLDNFEVHEDGNSQDQASRNTQKMRLKSFLESTVNHPDFHRDRKFSCNLEYRVKVNGSQLENNENNVFEAKVFSIIWDEIPAVAVILHDITQQNTIMNLKVADARKDTLLATVSHELRTPLNGMLGMIQIMQKKTQDSEFIKYLNICKNSGNLLMGLVNSILDLNQIRAQKLKLNPETVNLYELLSDIIRLFELQCAQKGIYLKLSISPSTQKHIVTDQNRLSQIFINLVGNALKFTMKGGITISAQPAVDKRYIELAVRDTGIGVKDQDQEKLFKMFGKLEQSDPQTNKQGVGFGLTISDNLARLLYDEESAGGIRLSSRYGQGSVFCFQIKSRLTGDNQEADDSMLPAPEEDVHVDDKIRRYATINRASTFQNIITTSEGLIYPNRARDSTDSTNNRCRSAQLTTMPITKSAFYLDVSMLHKQKRNIYVLVVDDNPFNVTVAECLINSQGYKTKTALYAQTAIDITLKNDYTSEPINLILMDCQMPVMDGYEATKILQKFMKQGRIPKIPVVALTANNSESDREAARKAGMCEYLTKPLKEADLSKILARYME